MTLNENSFDIPAHIPADRLWVNRLEDYAANKPDPYKAIADLHQGPAIIWSPIGFRGTPSWIFTRYAEVCDGFADHQHFSSAQNADLTELLGVDWKLNPLEYDPPQHHVYRHILQAFFTPSKVNQMGASVKGICDRLLDPVQNAGGCEFIDDFASRFPSLVFLSLMGLPLENLERFLRWEAEFFRGETVEQRVAAAQSILASLEEVIESRLNDPQDDLISQIVHAKVDGRPIAHNEYMGMVYVLYLGGLDTVLSTSGRIMHHLATHPDLQARLRNQPDQIPRAIEELLRAYGVTQTRRIVTEDFEFHGVQMRKGETVMLPTYLANRDPDVFENPHEVDIDRENKRHLTFATGVHNCLGIHLARRELKVIVESFLSRFNNITVRDGQAIQYHTEGVWGLSQLPLSWDAR